MKEVNISIFEEYMSMILTRGSNISILWIGGGGIEMGLAKLILFEGVSMKGSYLIR